ncbi:MAG: hypothetical protein OXL37_00680 [Chloroflexota bacterium]|nr:hypothetical protein [Chloroflexota bacterium]MDE2961115.1 hypothetical protein [Chloroflexota bacterium]
MNEASFSKDLVVLAADGTIQRTVQTLLEDRQDALGISALTVDIQTHRHHDSGCRSAPGEVINPLRNLYRKGMLIFDFHGSGETQRTAAQLEVDLEQQLQNAGWGHDRIAVVAIEPELEAWVFGASVSVLEGLVGWSQPQGISDWLELNGFITSGETKPNDPQAAFDGMLQMHRKRRSRKLFADLARTVSFSRCQDRAFQKFRATLQRWFPAE